MSETNIQNTEKPKKSVFKGLVGGNWIIRNMNFFLFLSVLAGIYIANGQLADRITKRINQTEKELKDLQYEYKTLKSEVMFKSREDEVMKATNLLGLKINKTIPRQLQEEKITNDKK